MFQQAMAVRANYSSVAVLPKKKYRMNSVKCSHGVILEEKFINETFFLITIIFQFILATLNNSIATISFDLEITFP